MWRTQPSTVDRECIIRGDRRREPTRYEKTVFLSFEKMLTASASSWFSRKLGLLGLVSAMAIISQQSGFAATDGEEKTPADTVTMSPGPLELKALGYLRFREDITAIEGLAFDNAQITRDAHKRLASHNSNDLVAGWVAYAALIAADTPAFSDAIKAELLANGGADKNKKKRRRKKGEPPELTGRDAFIAKISAEPRYPRSMPGADAAIAAVLSMTNSDYSRMSSLGENFKSQAYAMQKTRWGKSRIAKSASERISEAEYYTTTRPGMAIPKLASLSIDGVKTPGVAAATDYMWKPDWGFQSSFGNQPGSGSDAVLDRILNLAARYAVGALNEKVVQIYAADHKSEQCMSLVKLTLKQCIAATRTPYEEAFCLGEHGINDVANCVGWVAGHSG